MKLKRFVKNEDGVAAIICGLLMVIILGFTAVSVDLGLAFYQEQKLQTALDSAALAASLELPDEEEATQIARNYMEFYYQDDEDFDVNDVVITFLPEESSVKTKIRLNLRHEVKTNFAPIFMLIAPEDTTREYDHISSNLLAAAVYQNQRESTVIEQTVKKTREITHEIRKQIDFPYVLFQGGSSKMNMGGQFAINGGIHTNGSYYISPGGLPYGATSPFGDYKSYISGGVEGVSNNKDDYFVADVWNVGRFYYNWWSCNVGEATIGDDYIETPDYDEIIMEIAPTYDYDVYDNTNNYVKLSMVNGSWNNFYFWLGAYWGRAIGDNPNTTDLKPNPYPRADRPGDDGAVPYNVMLSGNFSGRNHATEFNHSVYFPNGVSNLTRSITVKGDLYSRGNFVQTGGTVINVVGNVYIIGNADFGSTVNVGGDVFVTGNFTKGGGNIITVGGDMYSGGNMNFGGGLTLTDGVCYCGGKFTTYSGNPITVNGVIIAEDDMDFGGMPIMLNTTSMSTMSIYSRTGDITFNGSASGTEIYGMVYAPHGEVKFGSGNLKFFGSVIAEKLTLGSGGFMIGENNRALPYLDKEIVTETETYYENDNVVEEYNRRRAGLVE